MAAQFRETYIAKRDAGVEKNPQVVFAESLRLSKEENVERKPGVVFK